MEKLERKMFLMLAALALIVWALFAANYYRDNYGEKTTPAQYRVTHTVRGFKVAINPEWKKQGRIPWTN